MYKEFFNFSAEPFRVTPDPGFLYLTDQHKEALAAIIYGIAKRKGFVCITGEVGVGKTTILRSYLDSVDEPGLRFVYIFNPNVSFQALLRHILKEISLDYAGDDIAGMVEALKSWLIAHHKRRDTLVLLIDEAQNMPIGTLESLRMLSNLETSTEKLVQIVLVGQPELDQVLSERQLRQLESRIAIRTRLGPLSKTESVAYIRHRLRCVALDDKPAFTDGAIKEIVRRANGIPRRINVLADNSLMNAYGHHVRPVTSKVVREVVRDMRMKDAKILPRVSAWPRLAYGGGAAAGLAVVAALAFGVIGGDDSAEMRTPAEEALLAGAMPPPPAFPVPEEPALDIESMAAAAESVPPPAAEPIAMPAPPLPPPIIVEPEPRAAEPPPEVAPPPAPAVAAPARVTAPKQVAVPDRDGRRNRVLRIVAPGDTLAGLTLEVYGRLDGKALNWVKHHNPDITNLDRIHIGQVIEFPEIPGEERQ